MAKEKAKKAPPSAVENELASVEKEYRRELAVTKARPVVTNVFYLLWAALDVALIAAFLLAVGGYLVSGSFTENRWLAQTVSGVSTLHQVSVERAAEPLGQSNVRVFSSGAGYYDFFTIVENQNEDWYATFDYYFDTSAGSSKTFTGFVLPKESRELFAVHQAFEGTRGSASLVIENFTWHRIDRHEIKEYSTWLAERDRFVVTDADYASDVLIENQRLSRSSFTIQNQSPYSYWEATFLLLLEQSGTVVAVNQVTLTGFDTEEELDVNTNWFGNPPSAATLRVVPAINYFDDDIYMPLSGETESDIRDRFR